MSEEEKFDGGLGSEMFLADVDPREDRGIRMSVMNPQQICLEVVKKVDYGRFESVGPQLFVSTEGLVRSVQALAVDDRVAEGERQGFVPAYDFRTVSGRPRVSREDVDA